MTATGATMHHEESSGDKRARMPRRVADISVEPGNSGCNGAVADLAAGGPPATADQSWTQVQRLERTLSSLERISRALTTTTDGVSVLLQTIAETVAEVFDCSFVFLVVKNGPDELSTMYAPRLADRAGAGNGAGAVERGFCINEHMLFGRGSMQVPCIARIDCPCVLAGNVMTVPMSRDGVLEGSISLQLSDDRDLDDYDMSTLEILANQATVAIQNARLFEESQCLRAQAESHYRMAVAQQEEAERRRRELEIAEDEIDSMERKQIISAERERIARELHDDVAQTLTSIVLNLQWCQKHLPPESQLQERIVCLKELARNGLYEVRKAILGLSPTAIAEFGLPGALEKLAGDFKHISRITARFSISGEPRPPRNDIETALYHICQEALYNVFKHAHAQRVDVGLAFESDAIVLTVADDGIGIDPESVVRRSSSVTFGLKSMRARAEELGGSLMMTHGPVKGACIEARIPG